MSEFVPPVKCKGPLNSFLEAREATVTTTKDPKRRLVGCCETFSLTNGDVYCFSGSIFHGNLSINTKIEFVDGQLNSEDAKQYNLKICIHAHPR
ncbi:MAG TPA: hypothetical protein VI819_00405 [Patescibacteria group bacterium]|nr:hypothetical protein [Patescibacteria group bacterium]